MRWLAGLAAVAVLGVAAPAAATPGPPSAPEYWLDSWHVPSLWNEGAKGQGITIAEIDTGVNAELPELRGRILPGTDLGAGGNGQVDREVDAFGHGTAMASIMVARPGLLGITGLAPGAKILPIAVPLRGTTDAGKPDRLPDAIRYAADHGARVISMSLGGQRSPKYDRQPCTDDEQASIYYALRKGALVLAAVGNTGPTSNTIEDPGVCLGVVSVGAVDVTGTAAAFSAREPYLTLAAPGVNVPSLGRVAGDAYAGNGTSQATAITSAVTALVWSKYPTLSARQVETRLIATLDERGARPNPTYGYGLLDAYRAVTAQVPADAPNPVYDAVAPFLARYTELGVARAPRPPPPAASPGSGSTGSYAVGSVSTSTATFATGVALAATGLVLIAALAFVGRHRRHRAVPPDDVLRPRPLPYPSDPFNGEPPG